MPSHRLLELFAEHGHLLRAAREFYSDYHTIWHLFYCAAWWLSKLHSDLGLPGERAYMSSAKRRKLAEL